MQEIDKTINSNLENARIIAITGGIGSGKSEVAKYLVSKGYSVITTDELAKVVMSTDKLVKSKIVVNFGNKCYDESGQLDSAYLSSAVFTGDNNQTKNINLLNSIVHPPVIDLMVLEIEERISAGKEIIFVESALIFEAELADGFDYIICVSAPDDLRISRVSKRSGLSKEQIQQRMKEQISQEKKIALSDFVIENNKSILDLHQTINFLLPIILSLPPNRKYEDDEEIG
jgi:dephospho-CoA kinase